MSNNATQVPLVAILNPNSGPGSSKNTTFVSDVATLHGGGGKVIGYFPTGYGTTNLSQVTNWINSYVSWYSVDGFFIDEMANNNNASNLNYYAAIYQYIKGINTNYSVTGNPGAPTQESYLTTPTADRLMIFKDESTNYPGYVPSRWVTNHLAKQFVNVCYGSGLNSTTMSNFMGLASNRNAGWIYFTDADLPNPYSTLPSYWAGEVGLVQSLNQSAPATQITIAGITNSIPSLKITGAPGVYEIQMASATNFSNWMQLQLLNMPAGTGTISDASALNRSNSFYRTLQ